MQLKANVLVLANNIVLIFLPMVYGAIVKSCVLEELSQAAYPAEVLITTSAARHGYKDTP